MGHADENCSIDPRGKDTLAPRSWPIRLSRAMSDPLDPTLTADFVDHAPTQTIDDPGNRFSSSIPNSPSPTANRFVLGEEIARGGMGVVYRATDAAFGREVAVKVLLAKYGPDSVAARRFADEARITGQLQHPAIPPVHDLGTLPDGRPFLAMKLIQGQTLDELLRDRPEFSTDRGRFVAAFEQVCQAVAYAHAHKVIHRDLKPANVMVGGYGEVQVMDWGLAKELGEGAAAHPDRSDETLSVEIRLGRDGGDITQAGSLLGTPAFMPPEQALGAIDLITERADVFGLGAILCVILTGQPPFVAANAEATRLLAAQGKLGDAFARLAACGAEAELIALAKRCLSPDAADRPADAGEVAKAVATLRADAERRARQAETDRATAEVKATEGRKRRRVQRALAAAVVAIFAGAGIAGWWADSEQTKRSAIRQAEEFKSEAELAQRRATTNTNVTNALLEAQVLLEQGLKQADDPAEWSRTLVAAESALKRADELIEFGEPTDELRARVTGVKAELDRDDRDRALLADLDRIADNNDIRLLIPFSFTSVVSRKYAATFRANGIDLAEVPTEEAVAWLKKHRFRDRLVIAVRGWRHSLSPEEGANFEIHLPTAVPEPPGQPKPVPGPKKVTRLMKLDAILEAVVDDPFTREWWDAVAMHNLPALKKLLARPELRRMSSRELASLSDGLTFFPNPEVQRELLALAYDRFPGEFWVHMRLTMLHQSHTHVEAGEKVPTREPEKIRHLTAAVAARPRSAIARTVLGIHLLENRKDPAGMRLLKSASEVDPTSPWPHLFLGMLALHNDDWAKATAAYIQAIRVDADTAYIMIQSTRPALPEFMKSKGFSQDALDEKYRQFVEEIAAKIPEHPAGYDLLGDFHLAKGNHREALVAFRQADRLALADYPGKLLLGLRLQDLESTAQWEGKIDAVLSGKIQPANKTEIGQIAGYLALFDKKYARAADFATEGLKADPKFFERWGEAAKFAGWAVQAGTGHGADAANLTPAERADYRRKALAWLRAAMKDVPKDGVESVGSYFYLLPDFAPVRDRKECAKLPRDEQDAWIQFWLEIGPKTPPDPPMLQQREVAPPPRLGK